MHFTKSYSHLLLALIALNIQVFAQDNADQRALRLSRAVSISTSPATLSNAKPISNALPVQEAAVALLPATNENNDSSRMFRENPAPSSQIFDVKDYGAVCDGTTDDSHSVQSAIFAAGQGGGIIQFSGRCGIGASGLLVTGNNVILKGSTNGSGITVLAPGPDGGAFGPTAIQFSGCSNCGAEYLYVDVNNVNTNAVGFFNTSLAGISNSSIHAAGNLGAVVSAGNRSNTYANNWISDGTSAARGLWIGNAMDGQIEDRAMISGNVIMNMKATGIVCTCSNSSITQNQSTHNGGSGIIFPAAGQYRASHVIASGNTASFNKFSGFQSDSSDGNTYSEFITLTKNLVEGNNSSGIYVVRSRDWVVQNNEIRNNLIHGVEVGEAKRIAIAQNLVEDTRSGSARTQNNGIHLVAQASGANDVQDVTVTGNVTRNNIANGIFVVNSSPNSMTGVTITSNTSTENGFYGIRASAVKLGDITNVSISNNSLNDNIYGRIRIDQIVGQFDSNQ